MTNYVKLRIQVTIKSSPYVYFVIPQSYTKYILIIQYKKNEKLTFPKNNQQIRLFEKNMRPKTKYRK